MNIWAPLPSDTNTLYVLKVPAPEAGSPVEFTPDPGVRLKILGARVKFSTGIAVANRYPQVSVLSGSDVLYIGEGFAAITANQTRYFALTPHNWGVGSAVDVQVYWNFNPDIYFIHGIRIQFSARNLNALDQFGEMVVFCDCWNDMTVKTGDK